MKILYALFDLLASPFVLLILGARHARCLRRMNHFPVLPKPLTEHDPLDAAQWLLKQVTKGRLSVEMAKEIYAFWEGK